MVSQCASLWVCHSGISLLLCILLKPRFLIILLHQSRHTLDHADRITEHLPLLIFLDDTATKQATNSICAGNAVSGSAYLHGLLLKVPHGALHAHARHIVCVSMTSLQHDCAVICCRWMGTYSVSPCVSVASSFASNVVLTRTLPALVKCKLPCRDHAIHVNCRGVVHWPASHGIWPQCCSQ